MPYQPSERLTFARIIINRFKAIKDEPEWIEVFVKSKNASEKILLRKASPKDLKEIYRLDYSFTASQNREYDPTLNPNWTSGKAGKQYFKKRIARRDGFVKVAQNQSGKLVGYTSGGIAKQPPLRIKARYAELENLFVEEGYRGCGLGGKLVEKGLDWCKKQRVRFVSLAAFAANKPLLEFYKKFGFKEYYAVMEKELAPSEKKNLKERPSTIGNPNKQDR